VGVGWLVRSIDAGQKHRKPLSEIEDDLFIDIGERRAKSTKFWVQLVLASVIAAGGVIGDSTPAVIGAMIIAPLGTPIYGLALAAVAGQRRELRRSLALLVSGIAVNILIGVLVGMLTVNRMPLEVNPQVVGRTSSTVLDLAIAVAVGVAGSFALTRKDVADILAGVAIAISLVPVLAVVGITLGSGRFDLALGALVLFLTNAAAILIAGALVFRAAGYKREAEHRDARAGRRAEIAIFLLVVLLLVPLGAASVRTMRYELWTRAVEADTEEWVAGTQWHLDSVTVSNDEIIVNVIGPGEPPPRDQLEKSVREDVPDSIPVTVTEEYGRKTPL
jgi:uncharacterized hydrophobic protein (TIGR00271 family)